MAHLVLTDDELALLRFTCDLFFVEESPLFVLEAEQREPRDYEGTYHGLVEKGVIDPHGFRITDEVLNRLAPVTECDARVVHLTHRRDGVIEQVDFYLLDEIAVRHQAVVDKEGATRHLVGTDMDQDELVEHLARALVPRRAGGDRVEMVLTPMELVALSLLAAPARADRRAGRRAEALCIPLDEAPVLLGKAPTEEMLVPGAAGLIPVPKSRLGTGPQRPLRQDPLVPDPTWDDALHGLVEKGALRRDAAGAALVLRPALYDFVLGLAVDERHTFVRYDFGEDEWFMRETTFLPVDGGLFLLAPRGEGGIRIAELDGAGLHAALIDAVGPLGGARSSDEHKRLAGVLHAREPIKA